MATIKDLEKYIDYEFSSGCYTGDDYKSFQTKYINFLRYMQAKSLATRECRTQSLLLFGIYQECGKQVRLHFHKRR